MIIKIDKVCRGRQKRRQLTLPREERATEEGRLKGELVGGDKLWRLGSKIRLMFIETKMFITRGFRKVN